MAIDITAKSQEAAARHEGQRNDKASRGRLERRDCGARRCVAAFIFWRCSCLCGCPCSWLAIEHGVNLEFSIQSSR